MLYQNFIHLEKTKVWYIEDYLRTWSYEEFLASIATVKINVINYKHLIGCGSIKSGWCLLHPIKELLKNFMRLIGCTLVYSNKEDYL
jgi:hypothetical protein